MWQAQLEAQGHACMSFNAWENDFVEDPLVAFLGEMQKVVDSHVKKLTEDTAIKKSWAEVKRIGGGVLRKALPYAVQQATLGILSAEVIKSITDDEKAREKLGEAASKLAEERLAKFTEEKEGIVGFKKSLGDLAQALTTKDGAKSPIIFFVDELDRCRPDFAVALLERIKHLFNVNQVVFVLSVDRRQLSESVKALYGNGMDADGYLRRFIDLAFRLPAPFNADMAFANCMFSKMALEEIFATRQNGSRDQNLIKESFSKYAAGFELSLRTQEQCFTELNVFLRTLRNNFVLWPTVLTLLISMRAFRSSIFDDLRERRIAISDITKRFPVKKGDISLEMVEPVLMVMVLSEKELETAIGPLNGEKHYAIGYDVNEKERKCQLCHALKRGCPESYPTLLLRMIEMTDQFS